MLSITLDTKIDNILIIYIYIYQWKSKIKIIKDINYLKNHFIHTGYYASITTYDCLKFPNGNVDNNGTVKNLMNETTFQKTKRIVKSKKEK